MDQAAVNRRLIDCTTTALESSIENSRTIQRQSQLIIELAGIVDDLAGQLAILRSLVTDYMAKDGK